MNQISGSAWPDTLGGGPIEKPRAVLVLGDLIDDGDLKGQTETQWNQWVADFGLDGTDGLLRFPVFEGWGNHDGPPPGKEKNGFSVRAQVAKRTDLRLKSGRISHVSENGMHYSWDWGPVHFVQLNIYPANRQHAGVRYDPVWHDPQMSLAFFVDDLKATVADSGRPVVLLSHCGFDTDWWVKDDWLALHDAVKDYNIILYMYGHSGTGVGHWKPDGAEKPVTTINTGQTEKGFFVVQITATRIRAAYRIKNLKSTPFAKDEWDGAWTWKYFLNEPIGKK